jgi:hypothetical protein
MTGACNSSDGSSPSPDTGVQSFSLKSLVPLCDASRFAQVYYITSENRFYYCDGSGLKKLDAVGRPGADGTTWLVSLGVASAAQCPNGGAVISVGPDNDPRNGRLDSAEIAARQPVCNGTNGTNGTDGTDGGDGTDGTNGTDGHDALVELNEEPPGAHCEAGGQRIDVGVDDGAPEGIADDGVLQPGEIVKTTYVCNGVAATPEECQPGTYASGDGSCRVCTPISHCVSSLTCTSATTSQCTQCEEGRYLIQSQVDVCQPCTDVDFCTSALTCTSAFDSTCSSCAPGRYLDDRYQCSPCTPVPFCTSVVTCTDGNDSTCSSCAPGYYLNDGSCTPCASPPGCGAVTCTTATDSTCTECASGYFLDTGVAPATCKACTPIPNCVSSLTCTSASTSQCTQCAQGSYLFQSSIDVCPPCTPIPFCTTATTCTNSNDSTCSP